MQAALGYIAFNFIFPRIGATDNACSFFRKQCYLLIFHNLISPSRRADRRAGCQSVIQPFVRSFVLQSFFYIIGFSVSLLLLPSLPSSSSSSSPFPEKKATNRMNNLQYSVTVQCHFLLLQFIMSNIRVLHFTPLAP